MLFKFSRNRQEKVSKCNLFVSSLSNEWNVERNSFPEVDVRITWF